jgi:hypothetical protein
MLDTFQLLQIGRETDDLGQRLAKIRVRPDDFLLAAGSDLLYWRQY